MKNVDTIDVKDLSEPSMVITRDGKEYTFKPAIVSSNTPVEGFLTVMTNNAGLQLRMLPNKIGTYRAGEGPNEYRLVDVWYLSKGKWYFANKDVGEAVINIKKVGVMPEGSGITSYDGSVEGSFFGTLVAEYGSEIIISNAYFKTVN